MYILLQNKKTKIENKRIISGKINMGITFHTHYKCTMQIRIPTIRYAELRIIELFLQRIIHIPYDRHNIITRTIYTYIRVVCNTIL